MDTAPIFILYLSLTISAAVGVYAFTRHHVAGAVQYGIVAMAYAITTVAYTAELTTRTFDGKFFWDSTQWLTWSVASVAFVVFAARYSGFNLRREWLIWVALLAFPVVFQVLDYSSATHELTRVDMQLIESAPFNTLTYDFGTLTWFIVLYQTFFLPWVGIYLLLRQYLRTSGIARRQVAILLGAAVIPLVSYILFAAGVTFLGQRDYMPITYAISNLIVAWGLFRYGLFDLLPIAREVVVDNLPDAMLVLDANDRIVDANATSSIVLGRAPMQMIGKPVPDVFAKHRDIVDALIDVERNKSEWQLNAGTDDERYIEIDIVPIYKPNTAEMMGRVVIVSDITRRKQVEQVLRDARNEAEQARDQAEQADRVKSAFLASMSHELRTPLNAIINFAKFLKKGVPGPVNEEQAHLVGSIADSGQHLLNLINDVLDMSKIQAGSLTLYTEDNIDLHELLDTALRYAQPLVAEKEVEIRLDAPSPLPALSGDRKRLLQILLNILSNACKFTDEGTITVTVQPHPTTLQIAIADTGMGIAPEDAEHVFTAFKQTDSGLRQGGSGTGLGMPITQKLVEAHEGHIWFESERNVGTTFYVELPLPGMVAATDALNTGQTKQLSGMNGQVANRRREGKGKTKELPPLPETSQTLPDNT